MIDNLTGPEQALWKAFGHRATVDLRDESEREIRAEVIRALLLGAQPAEPGQVAALVLVGAHVTGRLDLSYADIPYAARMADCVFDDRIDMFGARTRELDLAGSQLRGLFASKATVDGNLRLTGARCEGQVRLVGTRIEGALLLNATRLSGADTVLDGRMLSVGHDLLAGDGFRCDGEVQLSHAEVRGSVRLSGAYLNNPDRRALVAVNLSVGAVLNCCEGFTAQGRINLSFAKVGSQVCFERARLSNPAGIALSCRQLQTNELVLATATPIDGLVDLRHARLGLLRDEASAWPARVRLDGLAYEDVHGTTTVDERLRWLRSDVDGYSPQAYEQFAAAHRRRGREDIARTVLLHGQRHRRALLPLPARLWGYLQDVTVGYGYRPAWAAAWLAALLVAGTVVFASHRPLPVKDVDPDRFQPFVYTLDLLLPLVDFRQESAFDPRGGTAWLAYALVAAGWTLATTIAAGTTRTLRRM